MAPRRSRRARWAGLLAAIGGLVGVAALVLVDIQLAVAIIAGVTVPLVIAAVQLVTGGHHDQDPLTSGDPGHDPTLSSADDPDAPISPRRAA
jgi:hypothetical protein